MTSNWEGTRVPRLDVKSDPEWRYKYYDWLQMEIERVALEIVQKRGRVAEGLHRD